MLVGCSDHCFILPSFHQSIILSVNQSVSYILVNVPASSIKLAFFVAILMSIKSKLHYCIDSWFITVTHMVDKLWAIAYNLPLKVRCLLQWVWIIIVMNAALTRFYQLTSLTSITSWIIMINITRTCGNRFVLNGDMCEYVFKLNTGRGFMCQCTWQVGIEQSFSFCLLSRPADL